jgi:hypothetical protein
MVEGVIINEKREGMKGIARMIIKMKKRMKKARNNENEGYERGEKRNGNE